MNAQIVLFFLRWRRLRILFLCKNSLKIISYIQFLKVFNGILNSLRNLWDFKIRWKENVIYKNNSN